MYIYNFIVNIEINPYPKNENLCRRSIVQHTSFGLAKPTGSIVLGGRPYHCTEAAVVTGLTSWPVTSEQMDMTSQRNIVINS